MRRENESNDAAEGDGFRVVCNCAGLDRSAFRLVDVDGNEVRVVNDFLDASAVRGLSKQTLRTYAYSALSIWRWIDRHGFTVSNLSENHLAGYIREICQSTQSQRSPPARSINLRLLVARSIYRFHTGAEMPRSPGAPLQSAAIFVPPSLVGTRLPRRLGRPSLRVKVPRRLVTPLSREDVAKFFRSFRTSRDLGIVSLMLFCGLRSREVLSLRLGDVNVLQEQLHLRGKGNKDRVIPLAHYVRDALSAYVETERPAVDHDVLFVSLKRPNRGRPMTTLRELFRYHRKRSGIEAANPHRFRHTFAVDMAREGMPIPILMRLLGHTNIEMTMRYVNLSAEDVREEFEKYSRRQAQRRADEGELPKNL